MERSFGMRTLQRGAIVVCALCAACPDDEPLVAGNRAPALDVPANILATEGAQQAFIVTASDPDDDPVAVSAGGLPPGAKFDTGTGLFSWRPDYDAARDTPYTVTFTGDDGRAGTVQKTTVITIADVNRKPSLTLPDPQTVSEGSLLTVTVEAADADSEDLLAITAPRLQSDASDATFDGHTLQWTPGFDQQGVHTVRFTVTDNHLLSPALTESGTLAVTVVDVVQNHAPQIQSATTSWTFRENETAAFDVVAVDPDPNQTVSFSLSGAPVGADITSGGHFTWPIPNLTRGTFTFRVIATDSGTPQLSDAVTETVIVKLTNLQPVIGAVGPITVAENAAVSAQLSGSAAEPGDLDGVTESAQTLTWTMGAVPGGLPFPPGTPALSAGGAFTYSAGCNDAGVYGVRVWATDNGLPPRDAYSDLLVVVTETNCPPAIAAGTTAWVFHENELAAFDVAASDPDQGQTVSFSLMGEPSGAAITSAGHFTWPIPNLTRGTFSFRVIATDNGAAPLSDSVTETLVVKLTNLPPVLEGIPDVNDGSEGIPISIRLFGLPADPIDPDAATETEQTLVYSMRSLGPTALPPAATLTGDLFSWPVGCQDVGLYRVEFKVTDDGTPPRSDTQDVQLFIAQANCAPVFTTFTRAEGNVVQSADPSGVLTYSASEGSDLTVVASATDPDGDGLSYGVLGKPTGATFNADTHTFSWRPASGQAGGHDLTLTVSDGVASAAQPFHIDVTGAPPAATTCAGPTDFVSMWQGEGSASDLAGSNNGSTGGTVGYAPGKVGQAFSFNGSTGYVSVPSAPAMVVSRDSAYSVAAWVKLNADGAHATIAERWPSGSGAYDWAFAVGSGPNGGTLGRLNFNANSWGNCGECADIVTGSTVVSAGTWHHVAATTEGSSIKLYLDGALDGSGARTITGSTASWPLYLGGGDPNVNDTANALLDEVAYYSRALSAAEVQAIASSCIFCPAGVTCPRQPPVASGLKLWADAGALAGLADGATLNGWPDRSGNGFDLVDTAPTHTPPIYKAGIVNGRSAVRFDAQCLSATANSGLSGDVAASVFMVAKVATPSSVNPLFNFGTAAPCPGGNFAFHFRSTGLLALASGCGFDFAATSFTPRFGAWAILSVTKSPGAAASTAGFSVDGMALSASGGATMTVTNSFFTIGGGAGSSTNWPNQGTCFTGDVAETLVYGRAVSAAERMQIEGYLSEKYAVPLILASGGSQPIQIAVDGTHAYWTEYGSGKVMKVPAGGGAPVQLALGCTAAGCPEIPATDDHPYVLAVDADNVYWGNQHMGSGASQVQKVAKTGGGTPEILASVPSGGYVVGLALAAGSIFFVDAKTSEIRGVSVLGSALATVATGQLGAQFVAADGASVYWTVSASGVGGVYRAPAGGGTVVPIDSSGSQVCRNGIAVSAANVFWTEDGCFSCNLSAPGPGRVLKAAFGGGPVVALARAQQHPGFLAADQSHVYWTNGCDGTVMSTRVDGGGLPARIASGQANPQGIALDATNVYWVNQGGGTVMKAPKRVAPAWVARTPMPWAQVNTQGGVVDGILYAPGDSVQTMLAYDAASDSWSTQPSYPIFRYTPESAVVNGLIYILGGNTGGSSNTDDVQAYAPGGSWTQKAPMPSPEYAFTATELNGILYAAGGHDGSSALWAYNPGTNSWTPKRSMPTGREAPASAAVNGVLYVMGGMASGNVALGTLEAYDPGTDTWTSRAPMPTPRFQLRAVAVNGTLHALGGYAGGAHVATVEAYDPATNTWTARAPMLTPRRLFAAAVIDNVIYVAGGINGSGLLSAVEAYAP